MIFKAITTKYLGPTNHKGARIKAYAYGGSIIVPFDYACNGDEMHKRAAMALVRKMGWGGKYKYIQGCLPSGIGYCFVAVAK